jgi:phosphoribosylglycinamide formyltransferase-1
MAENQKGKIAILISGRGSNMESIAEACASGRIPAQISLVISNEPDAPGLQKARTRRVEAMVIDHRQSASREEHDRRIHQALKSHAVDLVCLAGYMRVLTPAFIREWKGKVMNIHPSLLPSFPGLDPHGQALQAGVKISGATVHFVIPEADAGPIIMQGAVMVADDDTSETLSQRILGIEHRIYPEALRLLASGKLRLEGGLCKMTDVTESDGTLISPRTI